MKPPIFLALCGTLTVNAQEPKPRKSVSNGDSPPPVAKSFLAFAEDGLEVEWDDQFLYIGSNGIPAHPVMKGITAWQQQIPIPHDFKGSNAFRIPLNPQPSEEPGELTYLGPIAIGVNGIPIFHALTQSGKDAYLGGELDQWGGHCGRADDYHYHIAPAHLEETVGKGNPVAFGLDGFPVIIADPANPSHQTDNLDIYHGATDKAGEFSYIGNLENPYMMSYFRGPVDLDARPRTQGARPFLRPLRGAEITDFEGSLEKGYHLTYELDGEDNHIHYQIDGQTVHLQFTDSAGTETKESHTRRVKPEGKGGRGEGNRLGGRDRAGKTDRSGRSPWILAHAPELDTDGDSVVTRTELVTEVDRVFAAQAKGERVRSAISGFLKDHQSELDTNKSGTVSKEEAMTVFTRMFDKSDSDRDGRITREQYRDAIPKNGERPPKPAKPAKPKR